MTKPQDMTAEELGRALEQARVIEIWLKAVREHAYERAQKGEAIPGFKLVKTSANRFWKDPEGAEAALRGKGLKDDELHERKLISPAQAEKKLGKANCRDLAEYVGRGSGGTTLAPEDDPREGVPSRAEDAGTVFASVPGKQ